MTDETDRTIAGLVRKKYQAKCRLGVIQARLHRAKETCDELSKILADEKELSLLDQNTQGQAITIKGTVHDNLSFDEIVRWPRRCNRKGGSSKEPRHLSLPVSGKTTTNDSLPQPTGFFSPPSASGTAWLGEVWPGTAKRGMARFGVAG